MGTRIVGCLLSCICTLAAAQAASAQARTRHFDDIGRIMCAEGTERYLPGDYYFCAANKAVQAGKVGKALAMYEESAAWGDKRAMFNLGLLYLRGESLPKDEPLGLAWLALSAERPGDQLQREVLAGAWLAASAETRSAADALWNRMKLQYTDRVALVRARERYERESRQLRRDLQRDPTMQAQIAGMGQQSEAGLGPMGQGSRVLQTLDEAATETILRPLPGRKGTVKVGAPETASEAAKPPAS